MSALRCSTEPDSAECGSIQVPNVSLDLLFGRPLDVGEELGGESWCRRCSSVGGDKRIWWPYGERNKSSCDATRIVEARDLDLLYVSSNATSM